MLLAYLFYGTGYPVVALFHSFPTYYGSEFINHNLFGYCEAREIGFTRGRPYKKDDNAHIEQKNWTHVRKLIGWDRYDSKAALATMNDLYAHELRLYMNLGQAGPGRAERLP